MLISTSKEKPAGTEAQSHSLSIMAGLIYPGTSGFYTFSPLGQKVLNKINRVIRKGMDETGALEISLPILEPATLWEQSGRTGTYGKEMFQLTDREGRVFFLAPTQEEMVVAFVKDHLQSYRQLPVTVYQISEKFRDEKRPRHGLLRTKEFGMKDAYSFDRDVEGLNQSYQTMRGAYVKILNTFGLKYAAISAASGEMGGRSSEEFMAFSKHGEDFILTCNNCGNVDRAAGSELDKGNIDRTVESERDKAACEKCGHKMELGGAMEVGHIFKLGTRYSLPLKLTYINEHGEVNPVEMGCYGIGTTRMISAIIEQHHDQKGIIWPLSVAPFEVAIVPVDYFDEKVRRISDKLHDSITASGVEVILDDRELSAGRKFKDADLIGIPIKVIVSQRNIANNSVEIESRSNGSKTMVNVEVLADSLRQMVRGLS